MVHTMLCDFFLFCLIFHSVSCATTCYECPMQDNQFDYFVSANNVPKTLNKCITKTVGDLCFIDIIWNRNTNRTQIGLSAQEPDKAAITNQHTFLTSVNLEIEGSEYMWTRSVSYICSTNQCNSLSVLERLLTSLTIDDQLYDLRDLLKPDEPFQGDCSHSTNSTYENCPTSPSTVCGECEFHGIRNNTGPVEVCTSCLTEATGETLITHEVDFDMNARTWTEEWRMLCQSKNCNTVENGNLIRAKSKSSFDFAKFFADANKSSRLTSNSLMVLLSVAFLVKLVS